MTDDDLLMELVNGRVDPGALGAMTPDDLAAWLAQPAVRARIAALCELGEMQSRLVTSRFRATAVSRLLSIATDDNASAETVRRACVDLLKLDRPDRPAAAPPVAAVAIVSPARPLRLLAQPEAAGTAGQTGEPGEKGVRDGADDHR